jgi:hypothetical protein
MGRGPVGHALSDQLFLAWSLSRSRLDGLGDDEFLWEPVDGCWSLRPPGEGQGGWQLDRGDDEPEPPPFTTIAWLVGHMTLCTWNWHDTIAGLPPAAEPDLPGGAEEACALWYDVTGRFERLVRRLGDDELTTSVEAWGGEVPRRYLVSHLTAEVLHHAAEVGRLRDLYRNRATWRG